MSACEAVVVAQVSKICKGPGGEKVAITRMGSFFANPGVNLSVITLHCPVIFFLTVKPPIRYTKVIAPTVWHVASFKENPTKEELYQALRLMQ